MNLIERYIFKKSCMAVLLILGSLIGVVWIVEALRKVDVIATNGQSILTYLSITTLAVPGLVLAIIPIALLLATIYTVNVLNANSELVIVSASGSSNWRIAKPLILLATLCTLVTGYVGHFMAPASLAQLRAAVTDMRADLITVIIREGTFNTVEKGLTFHVAQRGAGGILNGILIADEREENTSILYSAREGVVLRKDDGSFLLLKDGEIHQTDQRDGSTTVVKYQSYLFDLSSFAPQKAARALRAKERSTLDLLFPDSDDAYYKSVPERFTARIHERFSEMLWPFAYVFVVLAYAGQARSSRQNYGSSIGAAVIFVSIARGVGFSAISELKNNSDAVIYAYIPPIFCILFGLFFIIRNQPAGLPKSLADRLEVMNGKVSVYLAGLGEHYKRYLRRRAGAET